MNLNGSPYRLASFPNIAGTGHVVRLYRAVEGFTCTTARGSDSASGLHCPYVGESGRGASGQWPWSELVSEPISCPEGARGETKRLNDILVVSAMVCVCVFGGCLKLIYLRSVLSAVKIALRSLTAVINYRADRLVTDHS
ncbi:hypothetical protein Bbelb_266280 [Branchiostoma belcheri]|nr:hypothetical protein Bbelb_266280 [Branchiostoma belcheri]